MTYELRLSDAEDRGIKKGKEEGKIEMILEMLRENQPMEFISNISKFSAEKIREIAKLNGVTLSN